MKKYLAHFCFFLFVLSDGIAQKSIDLSLNYPPGSGISRNFSIYEPVGYNASKANKLIIGFHPFQVGTWNANSWRDTLRSFIDLTGALLVCPDGGIDGRVDDPIDLEFTETLIDSITSWYKIDEKKIFLIGFSVGGKAVYDYALSHGQQIKGSIPIGAAVEKTNYSGLFINGRCRPFYLVHGNNDSPNSRYYPMKTGLELKGAMVDGILMGNVGHTINFPQRNSILNTAFNFVDTSDCDFTGIQPKSNLESTINVYPSVLKKGQEINIEGLEKTETDIQVWNSLGQNVYNQKRASGYSAQLETTSWPIGILFIQLKSKEKSIVKRIVLKE